MQAIREHRWQDLSSLSERERALCSIAHKLSATPTRMVETDWDELRGLGFDDTACVEVAHVVGMFNYVTRLADGLGLELDPETAEAASGGAALRRPIGSPQQAAGVKDEPSDLEAPAHGAEGEGTA